MNAPLPPSLSIETRALVDAVLAFISRDVGNNAGSVSHDKFVTADFDALAIRIFAHQYANNAPYRRFCQGRGVTPRKVSGWRAIPPVPINAFKEVTLSSEPVGQCERVFMTSGTTRAGIKGRHHHPTLAVYDRSMTRNFALRFMSGHERLPMAILFPPESELRNSSLAHYLSLASTEFGTDASRYFVGQAGIDVDGLRRWLEGARRADKPCAILGASYSFVHVLDAFAAEGETFALPRGSRILDTGGYKRASRELTPANFYDALSLTFGVPREQCINMYGMTELSTQFYDDGNAVLPSVKSGPHWIRSRMIDPLTGDDVQKGDRGVLVHCDLANFNSTTSILTEDVGIEVDGGFLLLGRAEGAEATGCSLAVREFLKAVAQ